MNNIICEHIHIRASLAVLIMDDFTDKILQHALLNISVQGGSKPIKKGDGYYIFTNLTEEIIQLDVEAPNYNKETVTISLSRLNPLSPVVKVRIKPNRAYGIPSGTTCLEGRNEPFQNIRLVCPESNQFRKLLYDYNRKDKDKKEYLYLFNPEEVDLDGLEFLITDKDGKCSEYLRIVETVDKEEHKYRLEKVLENDYKKLGTKLYLVYHTKADKDGRYFLPVKEIKSGNDTCNCSVFADNFKKREIVVEVGKVNKFDFI